jgi:hypothetical protein
VSRRRPVRGSVDPYVRDHQRDRRAQLPALTFRLDSRSDKKLIFGWAARYTFAETILENLQGQELGRQNFAMFVLVIAIAVAAFIVLRVYFSPLSKIPGPKLAALTSLYYNYHEFKGDRHFFIDRLHREYGPIVRIGPSYVAIADPAAVKEIYGVGSWDKPKGGWYTHFRAYGEDNMFSTWEGREHLKRKKVFITPLLIQVINSMYKKTFLLTKPAMTALLESNTRNLIAAVNAASNPVNIFRILHYYATDVITEFTYGPLGNTNALVEPKYRDVAEEFALSKRRAYQLFQIHVPMIAMMWDQFSKITKDPNKLGVLQFGWDVVQNVKAEKIPEPEESLASLMFSANEFSDAYIASELIDHFVPSRF